MSPASNDGWIVGAYRYARAWFSALTDERTFDVRKNPSLWLGFLLALPIPILTFAADADVWLKIITLFSPVVWAMVMGAAGRLTIVLAEQKTALETEVEETKQTLDETTEALGGEVEKVRKLEADQQGVFAELELARAVQMTLQSNNISRDSCEVAIHQIPSQYVGGDYVHVNVVEDRWLYLIVADVSGHGIAAALVVARMHGMIRRLTLTKKRPTTVLEKMNRSALAIFKHTFFFMTVGVFRVDLRTGVLDYATAGHPAQLLIRADGTSRTLRTPNRLLGMDADIFAKKGASEQVQLEPGDTIALFSDGLFEILKDGEGEVLGESGLHERIMSLSGLEPALMIGETLHEIADFQGHSNFDDDVTLVAARYLGPPAAASPQRRSAS